MNGFSYNSCIYVEEGLLKNIQPWRWQNAPCLLSKLESKLEAKKKKD